MILFQYRIYRSDLHLNPHVIYVFGDNDRQEGLGGQAKEMRGEPNACGVPTKKAPDNKPGSFYTDDEYAENVRKIEFSFKVLEQELESGTCVVFPTEGLGTGLADLKNKAPATHKYIDERINGLVEKYGMTAPRTSRF